MPAMDFGLNPLISLSRFVFSVEDELTSTTTSLSSGTVIIIASIGSLRSFETLLSSSFASGLEDGTEIFHRSRKGLVSASDLLEASRASERLCSADSLGSFFSSVVGSTATRASKADLRCKFMSCKVVPLAALLGLRSCTFSICVAIAIGCSFSRGGVDSGEDFG